MALTPNDPALTKVRQMIQQAAREFETICTGASTAADRQAATLEAAERTAQSCREIASDSDELLTAIQDLQTAVERNAALGRTGSTEAARATDVVNGLSESAEKIGDVVSLISEIASQTNMLALNATIEAARAGDAGKGFAVVAGEVKNLANQTAQATEEITAQIGNIREVVEDAVGAIQRVMESVGDMSTASDTIKQSVDRQSAATRSIHAKADSMLSLSEQVSSNVSEARHLATDNVGRARELLDLAQQLELALDDVGRTAAE